MLKVYSALSYQQISQLYQHQMINKNEWSLINYTQKDISRKILSINQISHIEEEFVKLLALKQSYQKQNHIPKPEQLLKILNCKAKKVKEQQQEQSNLCSICFEKLSSNKPWCRICGNYTCKKCLVRQRELKDQTKTFFCQKCDQQYLKSMSAMVFYNKTQQLQKSFQRLVKEQENIEDLVNKQKTKLLQKGRGTITSQLIEKTNKLERLSQQNKIMKAQSIELQKKVQFGRNINRELKKKLHNLRKQQKQSFGTLSNTQQYPSEIQPPIISNQLDISMDRITSSVITEQFSREDYPSKCKCQIY